MNLYAVDGAENVFVYSLTSRATFQTIKSELLNLAELDACAISSNEIPSVLPYTLNSPGHIETALPDVRILNPMSKIGTGTSTTSHSPAYPLTR
jgi:hypothetical protein